MKVTNMIKISVLTAVIICNVVLFVGCGGGKGGVNNPEPQTMSDPGSVNITVNAGKIGQLAKSKAIELEFLVLEVREKDSSEVMICDSSEISGNSAVEVEKLFTNLAAPDTFVVTATSIDKEGKIIHQGSEEFATIPNDTVSVSLDLAAGYSMLQVAFNSIPDSVSKVTLGIEGIDTLESTFSRGAVDTVILKHDYLPADTAGKSHKLSIRASGSYYGNDTVLYAADTTVMAISGKDASYSITLKWVGPGIPPGAASITVTIGKIGTTRVDAGFGDVVDASLADKLVAYFPFNGNANDESGNGNHGVVNGATITSDRFGRSNKAYNFDGTDDYILVKNSAGFQVNHITIACWIKFSGFYSGEFQGNSIISKGPENDPTGWVIGSVDNNNDQYVLDDASERFYVRFDNKSIVNDEYIIKNNWYFIATTYDGKVLRCFVNGILLKEISVGNLNINNSEDLTIGCHKYGNLRYPYWVNGAIDDIRIYSEALSAEAIEQLYYENSWQGN